MYLSDKQLHNGDHILVADVGLNNNDGLVCWINRRALSRYFEWHHKQRTDSANELKIRKYSDTRGWYSNSWYNVVQYVALTRRSATPATEGVLTCKDPTCGFCSSVSLEVHYPSEFCVFSLYLNSYHGETTVLALSVTFLLFNESNEQLVLPAHLLVVDHCQCLSLDHLVYHKILQTI